MTPLRRIREKKQLTQRAVAKAVGIHYARLSQIESGDQTSPQTAAKLAEFYKNEITELEILYPKRYTRRRVA